MDSMKVLKDKMEKAKQQWEISLTCWKDKRIKELR